MALTTNEDFIVCNRRRRIDPLSHGIGCYDLQRRGILDNGDRSIPIRQVNESCGGHRGGVRSTHPGDALRREMHLARFRIEACEQPGLLFVEVQPASGEQR